MLDQSLILCVRLSTARRDSTKPNSRGVSAAMARVAYPTSRHPCDVGRRCERYRVIYFQWSWQALSATSNPVPPSSAARAPPTLCRYHRPLGHLQPCAAVIHRPPPEPSLPHHPLTEGTSNPVPLSSATRAAPPLCHCHRSHHYPTVR